MAENKDHDYSSGWWEFFFRFHNSKPRRKTKHLKGETLSSDHNSRFVMRFALFWLLDQLPKLCPINRSTDLAVLKEKFETPTTGNPTGKYDLSRIDVFVSIADPEKEPPLVTANTILSILATDYPVEKLACYVFDDRGALLTFESMAEAASFASMSKDYKLLAVDCQGLFEVYSLGSNSWKTIGNVPYIYTYREAEVIAIGDCHWLAKRRKDFSDVLVSPNTSNEIFKEIELPKEPLDTGFKFRNLAVLEGCLCVFVNANCVHLEVWVSGELFVYDPKNKSAMELNITRSINLYQDSYYFESLVSLNSGIYVGSDGVKTYVEQLMSRT
ncbi:hypothetical protein C5167_004137 [Papaver somniferum]|nr:hypothetical protein C5167_004137 [Papaver somniferum]